MSIEIKLNGEAKNLNSPCSVADLLRLLDLQQRRLAVEINQNLVSRSQFAQHQLQAGDKVEIVQAIGGG